MTKNQFTSLFTSGKPIIGVIHIGALPGTPSHSAKVSEIIQTAISEAAIYRKAGIHGVIIENMHDVPYLNRRVGPEIVSSMAVIGQAVKTEFLGPVGVQILAGANREALAVAQAGGLDFIRAEGFIFAHVADEGLMNGDAGDLLRYRKQIGADEIAVFTDCKKKHSSHAITADVSLAETVKAADFFLSDGIIITGGATGEETRVEDVQSARAATDLPILIGSGTTSENIHRYLSFCDGFIVGSWFKKDGRWINPVEAERVDQLLLAARD